MSSTTARNRVPYPDDFAYLSVAPPRRRRRPFWKRALVGLFGLVVLTALGLYLYPQPPIPGDQVARAREALKIMRLEVRPLNTPENNRALVLGLVVERLYAEEQSKWFRFRRAKALESAAEELTQLARKAVAEYRARLEKALSEATQKRKQLEIRLAAVAEEAEAMPADRGLQRAFSRARVSVDRTRAVEISRKLEHVETALKAATADVTAAEAVLGKRLARLQDPYLRRTWQNWVDETIRGTRGGGTAIVVEKARRRLYLVRGGKVAAEFRAELGRNGLLDKLHAGDGATPEGRYRITAKKDTGHSRFHRALVINYPNSDDLTEFSQARRRGAIPRGVRGPGSLIEIHGNGGKGTNWTDGCVAVRDIDIDRMFASVSVGTPVTIVGSARMPGD